MYSFSFSLPLLLPSLPYLLTSLRSFLPVSLPLFLPFICPLSLPRSLPSIHPPFLSPQFYINFTMEYFFIKLPDGSTMSFPNRLGDIKYKFFEVHGDARIVGIKIK